MNKPWLVPSFLRRPVSLKFADSFNIMKICWLLISETTYVSYPDISIGAAHLTTIPNPALYIRHQEEVSLTHLDDLRWLTKENLI